MKKPRQRREPGSLLFWLLVLVLLFVIVPYGFQGQSEPRLWNLPVWFHLSLAASVVISLVSAWRIWKHWHLEDGDE